MKDCVIYVHGLGGNGGEAEVCRPYFPGADLVGLDFEDFTPWGTREPIRTAYDAARASCDRVFLVTNSIGTYFAMLALGDRPVDRAFFVSPLLDMERMIRDNMRRAGVSEAELREKGTIPLTFAPPLSYDYLTYVRAHPVVWSSDTAILYAEKDALIPRDTVDAFAAATGARLTVMENGEHWLHTPEQMAFLDAWMRRETRDL